MSRLVRLRLVALALFLSSAVVFTVRELAEVGTWARHILNWLPLALLVGSVIMDRIVWRCPACRRPLGGQWRPERCPSCGTGPMP